jgi:uncharacterized membrane protein
MTCERRIDGWIIRHLAAFTVSGETVNTAGCLFFATFLDYFMVKLFAFRYNVFYECVFLDIFSAMTGTDGRE